MASFSSPLLGISTLAAQCFTPTEDGSEHPHCYQEMLLHVLPHQPTPDSAHVAEPSLCLHPPDQLGWGVISESHA